MCMIYSLNEFLKNNSILFNKNIHCDFKIIFNNSSAHNALISYTSHMVYRVPSEDIRPANSSVTSAHIYRVWSCFVMRLMFTVRTQYTPIWKTTTGNRDVVLLHAWCYGNTTIQIPCYCNRQYSLIF